MLKFFYSFLLLFHLINSIAIKNSFDPIKLADFTRTKFTLDNEFVILEYTNDIENDFNYEINFNF